MPAPKILAKVVTCATSVPGVSTGWACEMINVKPETVNSMPSVVMNELMPTTAVKSPLMSPMTMHARMARMSEAISGMPPLLNS